MAKRHPQAAQDLAALQLTRQLPSPRLLACAVEARVETCSEATTSRAAATAACTEAATARETSDTPGAGGLQLCVVEVASWR